jgi:hypothetical protein
MSSIDARDWRSFVAFLLVLMLNWLLILRHDNWMDELQALLIAREIDGPASLWEALRYEGHPPLWHLVLRLAIGLHDDVSTLRGLQLFIAAAIQALVFFACPWPLLARVMLGLSFYVLFEYGVISRSYSLGLILLFGYAALRDSRWRFALLAAMPQVALPFAALSGGLLFREMWRGERSLPVIAAWLVSAAIAVAFMLPKAGFMPPSSAQLDYQESAAVRVFLTIYAMSSAILPFDPTVLPNIWETRPQPPEFAFALGLAMPLVAILALRNTPLLALAVAGVIGVLFLASVTTTLLGNRHFGIVAMGLMTCEWLRHPETPLSPLTWVWLTMLALSGLWAAFWAVQVPMTEGSRIAAYIRDNRLTGQAIVAHPTLIGVFVTAHLRMPVVSLSAQCTFRHVRWNHDNARKMSHQEIRESLAVSAGGKTGPVYLLVQKRIGEDLKIAEMPEARLIRRFDKGMVFPTDLYMFPDPGRSAAAPAPSCP